MPRDPEDVALDEATAAFLASYRKAEVRPTLLERAGKHLRSLATVGVLIGYGAWCFAAGRLAGLLGKAGSFWHDLVATALITAPLFLSMWWPVRGRNSEGWAAAAFWAAGALLMAFTANR